MATPHDRDFGPSSRREFIQASGLALGGLFAFSGAARAWAQAGQPAPAGDAAAQPAAPTAASAVSTYFEWQRLHEGVHVAIGEGGNSMLLAGPKDALLVDTKNGGFGAQLLYEANVLAGFASIRAVINTHHHADHTGGNPAFNAKPGVLVMAHPKARERAAGNAERALQGAAASLKILEGSDKPEAKKVAEQIKAFIASNPTGKDFAPARAFDVPAGQSRTLPIGGEPVEVIHVGPGHTDNDLILFVKRLNVVHTGDLVFNTMWPYVDRSGGADIAGWIRSLEKLMAVCDDRTVVVPGHGAVTNKAGVKKQLEFFQDIRARAERAVKDGQSKEEFQKLQPEEYKDYAKPEFRTITLGGVWEDAKSGPVETAK